MDEVKYVPALALLGCLIPASTYAQNIPFQCGPDCGRRGRYVLCNDNFDNTMTAAGGLVLTRFLEAGCASFTAPGGNYSVAGFAALFGDGDMVISLLQVWQEQGADAPGMNLLEQGVGIQGSGTPNFTGFLLSTPLSMTGDFRICLKQQVDDLGQTMFTRPLLFDEDGAMGQNTVFIPGGGPPWQAQETGDFILRAIVMTDDFTPWDPGGECDMSGRDAGVNMPGRDGGFNMPGRDAGTTGPTPDGGTTGDMDAGTVDPGGPPTITAISPNEGDNATPVDVIVTGTNFVAGLTLKIGTIATDGVMVQGTATINATVPANIAAGAYDVIVTNPDGQSAILPMGYTVTAKGSGVGSPPEACSCRSSSERGPNPAWLLLFTFVFVRRRRARG